MYQDKTLVCRDCGQEFVPHGAVRLLKRDLNLDGPGIARRAMEVLGCVK